MWEDYLHCIANKVWVLSMLNWLAVADQKYSQKSLKLPAFDIKNIILKSPSRAFSN